MHAQRKVLNPPSRFLSRAIFIEGPIKYGEKMHQSSSCNPRDMFWRISSRERTESYSALSKSKPDVNSSILIKRLLLSEGT